MIRKETVITFQWRRSNIRLIETTRYLSDYSDRARPEHTCVWIHYHRSCLLSAVAGRSICPTYLISQSG
jgi:hypothetical protein